jgi:protein NirF
MTRQVIGALAGLALLAGFGVATAQVLRGTGDLGVVIERASGSLLIVDQSERTAIGRIEGLGDLSHASVVFSPDERFAYVFGRDGGLTKVDILEQRIAARVLQAGNSIGGAISDDGTLVAVSNYEPGGVRVFDAVTLEMVADIPAKWEGGLSKTIGLVDAPGRRFVFTLWDAGETWIADFSAGDTPAITRISGMGDHPYDALITGDGRRYIAGLFGEDGMTMAGANRNCRSTRCPIWRAGRWRATVLSCPPSAVTRCCGSTPAAWRRLPAPPPTASRSSPWPGPTAARSGSTSPTR